MNKCKGKDLKHNREDAKKMKECITNLSRTNFSLCLYITKNNTSILCETDTYS